MKITLKDGSIKEYSEAKSVYDIAKDISEGLARVACAGEVNGVEYFFVNEEKMCRLEAEGKVIEKRSYDTVHGVWHYFTVCDDQIDLASNHYVVIGTLESYVESKKYFGEGILEPIYIEVDDGVRLQRALDRERSQDHPRYQEMCRRYLADSVDFSEKNILDAGIEKRFENDDFERCLEEIKGHIRKAGSLKQ